MCRIEKLILQEAYIAAWRKHCYSVHLYRKEVRVSNQADESAEREERLVYRTAKTKVLDARCLPAGRLEGATLTKIVG